MENLDSEELLYLAMHAIDNNQHDIAIDRLKSIPDGPFFSKAQYLLAAEYAQIGLLKRAKEVFAMVCENEPDLSIAHFQKGLLHLSLGEKGESELAFGALLKLEDDNPLKLFGKGLIELINEEVDLARMSLEKGIELNTINEPLNNDMRTILEKVSTKQEKLSRRS